MKHNSIIRELSTFSERDVHTHTHIKDGAQESQCRLGRSYISAALKAGLYRCLLLPCSEFSRCVLRGFFSHFHTLFTLKYQQDLMQPEWGPCSFFCGSPIAVGASNAAVGCPLCLMSPSFGSHITVLFTSMY